MKDKITGYARIGVVQFMLYKEGLTGEADIRPAVKTLLEDDLLGAIELTWIKNKGVRAEVARMCRDADKLVAFGAQPVLLSQGLDLNAAEAGKRRQAIEGLKAVIPQAYQLGAVGFAVLSGPDPGPSGRQDAKEWLISSLLEVNACLKDGGSMPLILEIFDRKPFGKNRLIGSTSEAVTLASEIWQAAPDFGLMIDLSHLPLLGESVS